MKIISVVGARPNFIKIAPLHRAFQKRAKIESMILHTGQHYDAKMSDIFFNQLEMPHPDFYLGVSGGSHAYQKANVMLKIEEVFKEEKPDLVVVVGDVNATAAASLVSVKLGIPTAHVESGLRSRDRRMPEEINRIVTDAICDYLFVTEQSGMVNLAKEGFADDQVFFVGNIMIDSLIYFLEKASRIPLEDILKDAINGEAKSMESILSGKFVLTTMHRPQNVDNPESLNNILQILRNTTAKLPVIFPIHPRTSNNLKKFGLYETLAEMENLVLLEPLGYLQFLQLMQHAQVVVTDSGGIQEETTFLQVPCITFRSTTERPVTVDIGTNFLIADLDPVTVDQTFSNILEGKAKKGIIPSLWDGQTAERITEIISKKFKL